MCLHNPDCYIFHTKCRSCPYVSQFQHAKCACIIRTVIGVRSCFHTKCACIIRTDLDLVLMSASLACKMCLHNPDCYIFHTRCRSCPYVSQFQHAKCACIIRTVIFSYKVSILSLCQPVLACKMCLHNPDCYIFHTRCRSCPYVSQFQHAKCACIIRTVIFSYKVSILSLCQPVLACKMCLHNPDCYIFHTRCRSCPYVSILSLSLCQPVLACKMCLHNPDCYIFIQGVDLVLMSASFSMQNVLA